MAWHMGTNGVGVREEEELPLYHRFVQDFTPKTFETGRKVRIVAHKEYCIIPQGKRVELKGVAIMDETWELLKG